MSLGCKIVLFYDTRYNNPMKRLHFLLAAGDRYDVKTVLLYRFHLVLVAVNIIAVVIDTGAGRTINAWIESGVTFFLLLNAWYLLKSRHMQSAALLFLLIVAAGLFTQMWVTHFRTMSVIFVLLLPLTTMPFIPMRHSFVIEIVMVAVMALLLYMEYLHNPANPIIQHPKALFNLGYAAAIIYLFGLLYHFAILKTFNELDASNRQKALLLKEVYHRVKNNLNVIASIIGLQAASLKGREKEHLLKSKIRIESIAMVHEMLYRSDDLEHIEFEAYLSRLSDLLLRMYGCRKKVEVVIETDVAALPLETMVQLGIMVNELITNSIKYAFDDRDGGKITIGLTKEDETLIFTYADNGKGVEQAEDFIESDSLGIKLIRLTAKQLGGDVNIEHVEGLRYTVRFKDG